jgi:osmotically inducible lipoprotein OsmB
MKLTTVFFCLLASAAVLLGGCATYEERGVVGGALAGAAVGQIIGKNTKSTMIGAGVGAVGGALLNDRYKRF